MTGEQKPGGLEVVAKVVSAFGDPEAFGEREIEVVADLSRIPYQTRLTPAEPAEARIGEQAAEIEALTKALTGLTCGGSEFFIRKGDRFVADIPACVEWVQRSRQDAHRRTVEAIKRATAAEAKLARAIEGLERIVHWRVEMTGTPVDTEAANAWAITFDAAATEATQTLAALKKSSS